MSSHPEVVRDVWKYDGKLRYKDIPRRDASQLRKLLFPEEYPASNDEDYPDIYANEYEPPDVLDKKFALAQLSHYGLRFAKSATKDRMLKLLKDGLLAGKCDQVPPELQAIETELIAQYTPLKKAYELELKRKRLSDMEREKDFTQKALIGRELFISRYFQDANGRPNKTRTPDAITVPPWWTGDFLPFEIRDLAKKVSGLIATIEKFGSFDVLFLGWTDAAIKKARDQYAAEHAAREAEEAIPWEVRQEKKRTERHEAFLKAFETQRPKLKGSIAGKYLISCPAIDEGWGSNGDADMTLIIHATKTQDVYEANFDFQILEGVMILSADKEKLEKRRVELEANDHSDFSDSRESESSEEESSDSESSEEERKPASRQTFNIKRKLGTSEDSPAAKRSKTAGADTPITPLLKFWLQWRGRDTGSGEIQFDDEPAEHIGHIVFSDQGLARFAGEMEMVYLDGQDKFTGRKISHDPGKRGETWGDFSEGWGRW